VTWLSAKYTKLLDNCNLQFSVNYTKFFTSATSVCNPLSSIERASEVYGSKRIIYGIEGTKFWAAPSYSRCRSPN